MRTSRFGLLLPLSLCLGAVLGTQFLFSPAHALAAGLQPASSEAQATWSGTTWSGTFQSQHESVSPFTMTMVLGSDAEGKLVGTTSSAADCFTDASLQVTVKGPEVVLAGSDAEGNNITFRGTLDNSGTILKLRYVLNSSASGRCESDDGAGTLGKR